MPTRVHPHGCGTCAARARRCAKLHERYLEVRTAVCCDVAYSLSVIWAMRFVCILAHAAATVAAVAGYKRFRRQRDLWGPYASIQALEVGSYL